MITIKEMMDGVSGIDESELFKISDKLWKIGRLEEIKETVSPDLFYLHVGINMIGNWKGDGWWFLICEQADFVPYIPTALDKLNLPELKTAFENVIKVFIYSDKKDKMKRVTEIYGLEEEKAEKEINKINKLRANHYKYYTEKEWSDPRNYDICINSDTLGVEKVSDLICEMVKEKQNF